MESHLKVATFNVNGLTDKIKRHAIFSYLKKSSIDIYLLQETHSTPRVESTWAAEWAPGVAYFNSAPSGGSSSGGVAILFQSSSLIPLDTFSDLAGKIISCKINTITHTIHITNVYAPSGIHNRLANNYFFENLYPYVTFPHPTILAGDFNCVLQPNLDKHPPKPTSPIINKPI